MTKWGRIDKKFDSSHFTPCEPSPSAHEGTCIAAGSVVTAEMPDMAAMASALSRPLLPLLLPPVGSEGAACR